MHERALCTVHTTPPVCPIVYTLRSKPALNEPMEGRPVIPSIRGKSPFGERNDPGGVPSIDGPGGLNCYRSTLSLLYNTKNF